MTDQRLAADELPEPVDRILLGTQPLPRSRITPGAVYLEPIADDARVL